MEHITFAQYAFDFWIVPFVIFAVTLLPLNKDCFSLRFVTGLKLGSLAAAFTHLSTISLLF